MSFGQVAQFSFAVILCFAAITASAQNNGTAPPLTANTIQIYAPADVATGTAYIIPESLADTGMCKSRIVSADIKDAVAEIVRRSDCLPHTIPAIVCDGCDWTVRKVWKEIYKVQGDKLVFQKRIDGKIIPAQAERIEWPRSDTHGVMIPASGAVWLPGSGTLTTIVTGSKPTPHKKKRHHRRVR